MSDGEGFTLYTRTGFKVDSLLSIAAQLLLLKPGQTATVEVRGALGSDPSARCGVFRADRRRFSFTHAASTEPQWVDDLRQLLIVMSKEDTK